MCVWLYVTVRWYQKMGYTMIYREIPSWNIAIPTKMFSKLLDLRRSERGPTRVGVPPIASCRNGTPEDLHHRYFLSHQKCRSCGETTMGLLDHIILYIIYIYILLHILYNIYILYYIIYIYISRNVHIVFWDLVHPTGTSWPSWRWVPPAESPQNMAGSARLAGSLPCRPPKYSGRPPRPQIVAEKRGFLQGENKKKHLLVRFTQGIFGNEP